MQGFTLEPLARLAGFGPAVAGPGHEETVARLRMAEAGLARLEEGPKAVLANDRVSPGQEASPALIPQTMGRGGLRAAPIIPICIPARLP